MNTAWRSGYERILPWPERARGEIDAFIAARGLELLNFVYQNQAVVNLDPREFSTRTARRLERLMRESSGTIEGISDTQDISRSK